MTSITKAAQFIELLKTNGWKGKLEQDPDTDYAKIEAARAAERLEICWVENKLAVPPLYSLAGVTTQLHYTADARKVVTGRPDMDMFVKRRRRKARQAARAVVAGAQQNMSIEPEKQELPFDIHEDSDREILLAIRGSTVVWENEMTGLAESSFVPRESNRNLEYVFYLAESSSGRAFVSFMDVHGTFRAVHLDKILQVR